MGRIPAHATVLKACPILFGLDKLGNINRTVHKLERALAGIAAPPRRSQNAI